MLRDRIIGRCLNAGVLVLNVQLTILLIILMFAIPEPSHGLLFACRDGCGVVAGRHPRRLLHNILMEVNGALC